MFWGARRGHHAVFPPHDAALVTRQEIQRTGAADRQWRNQYDTVTRLIDPQAEPARTGRAAKFQRDRQREGRIQQFGRTGLLGLGRLEEQMRD